MALASVLLSISCVGCVDNICYSRPSSDDEIVGDLDTWRAQLLDQVGEVISSFGDVLTDVVQGECGNDGPVFLFRFIGPFTWEYDYFDRQSGRFIARTIGQSDVPPFPCAYGSYYPTYVRCGDRVVTEVLAGDGYRVGDTNLP